MKTKEVPRENVEVLEVLVGVSKTVQKRQFEPIKIYEQVVVSGLDLATASNIYTPVLMAQIDNQFRLAGMEPSTPTAETRKAVPSNNRSREAREFKRRREENFEAVDADKKTFDLTQSALIRLEKEGIVPKSRAQIRYLRFEEKISYEEFNAFKKFADVLGLPETTPKKENGIVDAKAIIGKLGINGIKHAGKLRLEKKLSYDEYMAIRALYQKEGEPIFVVVQ